MFKQRLFTVMILVPLVLLAIYEAPFGLLGALVVLLMMVGGWEWLQLIPLHTVTSRLGFLLVLLSLVGLGADGFHYGLIMGLLLWMLILFAVMAFPASEPYWGYRVIVGSSGLLLLFLFSHTLMALYQYPQGKDWIVYVLCLVWATDIGAYLSGKQWGSHLLIPKVSPGKTVEGALGGFAFAMLIAFLGYGYFHRSGVGAWMFLSISTSLAAMLGDLFISMLKRRSHIKDTGHIFPGHGGVLDRIDSLLAALPVFYYGLSFGAG
jgi:phosphatidate cytidylyltransferase